MRMIRIVKEAYIINMNTPDALPTKLPMIPSSGTYKETDEHTESGMLKTIEFGCRLRHRIPGLDGRLIMTVIFADCQTKTFGTEGLPVRLNVEDESLINISCKYKTIG